VRFCVFRLPTANSFPAPYILPIFSILLKYFRVVLLSELEGGSLAMTHYKMPKQPIDDTFSDKWGIASLTSVGAGIGKLGGNARLFDLINMETYRAHRMSILDLSVGKTPIPISGSVWSSGGYTYFKTPKPMNFPAFNDKGSEVITRDAGIYSWNTITIYEKFRGITTSEVLAMVRSRGFSLGIPEISMARGDTTIHYSDGKPVKTPDYELRINLQSKEELFPGFKVSVEDDVLVFKLSDEILFDFDKDLLHYKSDEALGRIFTILNSKKGYSRIKIEGHTDSIERIPGYNLNLSIRRAKAVENYFRRNKWALDTSYHLEHHGFGATKPVAPNKFPNGMDNPDGRAKNRRVEIYVYKR
jgi:outer membrane protein OmpA-like peptidoglycan-associated protein